MELLIQIISIASIAGMLIIAVAKFDNKITRMNFPPWIKTLLQSLLYAIVFTPTAYHHAPNTIIAPLHLSTICGNLFYGYEYTMSMFIHGVVIPILCGWAAIGLFLSLRQKIRPQTKQLKSKLV